MRLITLVIISNILLSGCAMTRDGVQLSGPSGSKKSMEEMKSKLESNAAKATADELMTSSVESRQGGSIVVGELGPYRAMDERDLKKEYKFYVKISETFNKDKAPSISEADYIKTYSGWTSVEVWSIPGFLWRRQNAMVPRDLAPSLNHSSTWASNAYGATGDLVGCKSNKDGVISVVQLLCKDGDKDCYKAYRRGIYEINTGRELSNDFKLKDSKVKIDPISFKLVQE